MGKSEVKACFDEVAGEWAEMRLSFYDERVIEQLSERTRLDGSHTVVDVGTGTGFVAAGLAPRAERVIAVDNSPGTLEVAGSNLDRLGIANVQLTEGELDALPLPDDSVDAAVANMVLHPAREPATMLAEMARVTRPGGWVAITDKVEHPYEWMRIEQADVWLGLARRRSKASSATRGSLNTATRQATESVTQSTGRRPPAILAAALRDLSTG